MHVIKDANHSGRHLFLLSTSFINLFNCSFRHPKLGALRIPRCMTIQPPGLGMRSIPRCESARGAARLVRPKITAIIRPKCKHFVLYSNSYPGALNKYHIFVEIADRLY